MNAPTKMLVTPDPSAITPAFDVTPVTTSVGNYFVSNYPPFSSWSPEQISRFLHALSRRPKPEPLGLYVHVPFCRQRCHYCYFRVYPRRRTKDVDEYVNAIHKELALYLRYPALENRSFTSVYFGGGSPSYLSEEQIHRLIGGLQEQSNWNAVEECTFECEPRSTTPAKFKALKERGITRLSIGFQTLTDSVLRQSGRTARAADCVRAFHDARAAGFDEINIDLLAGLAGETEESWTETIEQVIALAPDCVTIYQFELAYNSTLYNSIKAGRDVPLPSWPTKRDWVRKAFEMLEQVGYVIGSGYMAIRNPQWWRFVYTVEHFWHGADLIGLGESAFGHVQGVHYQNMDAFGDYTGWVQKGVPPVKRALRLTPEERLRREVILHLKTGALDCAYFEKKFSVNLLEHFGDAIDKLLVNGFLEVDGATLRLTREGLLRVDWLLPQFYLPEHRGIRYT
jgi:oxygen-independent coproporphyrinogen III oxidase